MTTGILQTRVLSLFTIFVVLTSPQLLQILLVSLNISQQWDIFESSSGCDHCNQWFLSCKNAILAMNLHHVFMLLVTTPPIFLAVVSLSIFSDSFFNL